MSGFQRSSWGYPLSDRCRSGGALVGEERNLFAFFYHPEQGLVDTSHNQSLFRNSQLVVAFSETPFIMVLRKLTNRVLGISVSDFVRYPPLLARCGWLCRLSVGVVGTSRSLPPRNAAPHTGGVLIPR